MTETLVPRAATKGRPIGPIVAAIAVLVLAVLPVRRELAGETDWGMLGAAARMQLGWEAHTRRAIDAGELPLWNPYHSGGRPHLADPRTLALYPPHMAIRLLPIDRFFAASFVLHAWVFGLGACLLARQLGASTLLSLLAPVAVMLPVLLPPRPDLAYSPSILSVAWIPLAAALALQSFRRPAMLPHAGLVLVLVMALTGVPSGQAYALMTVGACYLLAALWPAARSGRTTRTLARFAVLVCLAGGLAAFQLLPHARLWAAAAWAGGLSEDDREGDTPQGPFDRNRSLAAVLASTGGGRTISECDDALHASEFLWHGIAGVAGYGGAYVRDYVAFARLATDEPAAASGGSAAGAASLRSARSDLLRMLNVRYAVSCSRASSERWTFTGQVDGVTISQDADVLPRAFWTCAPQRVPREELEYGLRTYRYDETLTLREANPVIHVRWTGDMDEPSRLRAEAALNIRPRGIVEGTTWRYDLIDTSRANVAEIVRHPGVEDTAGIDRGALSLPAPPEPSQRFDGARSEWLLGGAPCDEVRPATIVQMDRADGHLVATVDAPQDGLVFLSETYHPDRTAWVDGERVEALKVNLAFTGVPVTAGIHRVELRAGAGSLWLGSGITALTVVAWIVAAFKARTS